MKITKRIISILLVVQLCIVSLTTFVFAEKSSIAISTAEEFCDFAKKCTLDSYSDGLEVTLTASIDLSSSDFDMIPIFKGTFNGCGFTISGVNISKDGSYLGLFRHLTENAIVRALCVDGTIEADGSAEYIGGIAGENSGTIENCSFKGKISGSNYVGGISGTNNGVISGSRVVGSVLGENQVGGVSGFNECKIVSCENYATVNTEQITTKKGGFDLSAITSVITSITGISSLDDLTNINLDNYAQIKDVGGICGLNNGTIDSCSNNCVIGYSDQAYNVGGIAGRSSGYVNSCTNYGFVTGRKDVGGIVGQLVPFADWDISVDKLDELVAKIKGLDTSFGKITDSISSVNGISGDVSNIKKDLSDIQSSASKIATGVSDDATRIIDSGSKIISLVSSLVNDIKEAKENFDPTQAIKKKVIEISEVLKEFIDEQSTITDSAKTKLKQCLDSVISFVNSGDYDSALESIKDFYSEIASSDEESKLLLKYGSKLIETLLTFDTGIDFDGFVSQFTDLICGIDITLPNFSDISKAISKLQEDTSSLIAKISKTATNVTNSISLFSSDVQSLFTTFVGGATELISGSIDGAVDLSISNAYSGTNGAISDSKNFGDVTSQTNAGGIVGSSSIELSFDSEDVIDISSYLRSGAKYLTYACVRSCQSSGKISTSKKCAGGIAGNMDFGYICDCTALGEISAEENYVGGIAGQSSSVISGCTVRSTVSAQSIVGGVAGSGEDISSCYVFSKIDCDGEKVGSIAGYLDGTATQNYYVDFGIGGIDGVSYETHAEGVSYEKMLQLTGQNDDNVFEQITVTFMKDGEVYAKYDVDFGGSLETIPSVPMDGNRFWEWNTFDNSHIYYSITVEGSYHSPISSISTSEDVPTFLAEGDFYDGMELVAVKTTPSFDDAPFNEDYVIDSYKVEITNYDGAFKCHWHEEPGQDLYLLDSNGKWQKTDYQADGSYVVFDMDNGQSVCYVNRIHFHLPIWAIVLIVLGALAIIGTVTFVIIRKVKKSKSPNSPESNDEVIEQENDQ